MLRNRPSIIQLNGITFTIIYHNKARINIRSKLASQSADFEATSICFPTTEKYATMFYILNGLFFLYGLAG